MRDFIRKFILLCQGKLPDYNDYLVQTSEFRKRISEYELELSYYKKQATIVDKKTKIPVAGFDDLNIEPTDEAQRKAYAARVDEFYEDILKKKIHVSIAEVRELLSAIGYTHSLPPNMTRDQYDFFLRGIEAFAWKIHEWATTLQGELRSGDINKDN